jgi:hypothetical protein
MAHPNTKHGYYGTRTYSSWHHMMGQCYRKSHIQYDDYGGREIEVDAAWWTFENFLKDIWESVRQE